MSSREPKSALKEGFLVSLKMELRKMNEWLTYLLREKPLELVQWGGGTILPILDGHECWGTSLKEKKKKGLEDLA